MTPSHPSDFSFGNSLISDMPPEAISFKLLVFDEIIFLYKSKAGPSTYHPY